MNLEFLKSFLGGYIFFVLAPISLALVMYLLFWGSKHNDSQREYLFNLAIKIFISTVVLYVFYLMMVGKLTIILK